jgi:hypothetical protein
MTISHERASRTSVNTSDVTEPVRPVDRPGGAGPGSLVRMIASGISTFRAPLPTYAQYVVMIAEPRARRPGLSVACLIDAGAKGQIVFYNM